MKLEREMLRGVGVLVVLKLLSRRAMYGYELVQSVSAESEGVLAMGQSTLYPLLYNLESQGLIEAEWRDGTGARQRKYYQLTDRGQKRLVRDEAQWGMLVRGLRGLLNADATPEPA